MKVEDLEARLRAAEERADVVKVESDKLRGRCVVSEKERDALRERLRECEQKASEMAHAPDCAINHSRLFACTCHLARGFVDYKREELEARLREVEGGLRQAINMLRLDGHALLPDKLAALLGAESAGAKEAKG